MEKLFKIILKMQKNKHKPDLHSFIAQTKQGFINVEVNDIGEVLIKLNGDVIGAYNAIQATNKLEQIGINLDTIEM